MAEGFRSFGELLAAKGADVAVGAAAEEDVDVEEDAPHLRAATLRQAQGDTSARECRPQCDCPAEAIREVKLFRARVAEAVEAAVTDLLCDIASDVLARELQLQPAELRAIVERALDRFAADEPLRVRIAHDEPAGEFAIPIVRDASLLPGDAIVEFRSGSVDARLGTRLARVPAALR